MAYIEESEWSFGIENGDIIVKTRIYTNKSRHFVDLYVFRVITIYY